MAATSDFILREKFIANRLSRWFAILAGTGFCLFAGAAQSDEISVIATPAVRESYLELVPQFEKATGHRVVTQWVGTTDLMKRVAAGENADLVIVGAKSMDELIHLGRIVPGSRVDLVKSGIGVAVRAGAPKPDISSGQKLKQTLLSAKTIGVSSGPSGVYLDGLFQRMGIAEQLKPKLVQPPSGASIGQLIARGDAEIGFQQISELLHVAGTDYLGPLPPDVQLITVFASGIHVNAANPLVAKVLASFLVSPAAIPVIRKYGMEPG